MTVAVGSLYGSLMILLLAIRLRSSAARASRPCSDSCVASTTSGLRSSHYESWFEPATPHGRAARQHLCADGRRGVRRRFERAKVSLKRRRREGPPTAGSARQQARRRPRTSSAWLGRSARESVPLPRVERGGPGRTSCTAGVAPSRTSAIFTAHESHRQGGMDCRWGNVRGDHRYGRDKRRAEHP